MLAEIRKWSSVASKKPAFRVVSEVDEAGIKTQKIMLQAEPGLEIAASLAIPAARGRKTAVLLVNGDDKTAALLARRGAVVLSLVPRSGGTGSKEARRLAGDWVSNARASLIGLNLPGMRAADIMRGVDLLAARPDVNAASIAAVAHDVQGVWLLMAAALDPRIGRIWLQRTPYSLRAALDGPVNRNLHDAIIPGFALRWDLADLKRALGARPVIWTDPTDWMGTVVPNVEGCLYRTFEDSDDRYWDLLVR
jgi:hypothetical protein